MVWLLSFLCLFFLFICGVVAQTSEAICLPYYSWTTNSQGKTPCEVASSLLAICNGGTFNVLPLQDGQHYQGPALVSNANSCQCNTVTFSLMSACGLCQGRSILHWSQWSANCPTVTLAGFPEPLPAGLRVPAWAYQDVRTNDTFDQFLAKENSNRAESSLGPSPTLPSTTTTVSPTPADLTTTKPSSSSEPAPSPGSSDGAVTTADPSQQSSTSTGSLSNANAIGGSVVGALMGSALIIGLLSFWMHHRRQHRNLIGERLGTPKDGSFAESQPEEMRQQLEPETSIPSIRISATASSQGHRA